MDVQLTFTLVCTGQLTRCRVTADLASPQYSFKFCVYPMFPSAKETEDNLSCIKPEQVEMYLSKKSVEDTRNSNCIMYYISCQFLDLHPIQFSWIPDQESCTEANGVSCYDTWQVDKLLHNPDSLDSAFQYETQDLRDMVPTFDHVLVLLGLDGIRTVISKFSIYDQNISQAVESMQDAHCVCCMRQSRNWKDYARTFNYNYHLS